MEKLEGDDMGTSVGIYFSGKKIAVTYLTVKPIII
jgi:hypothetical protein